MRIVLRHSESVFEAFELGGAAGESRESFLGQLFTALIDGTIDAADLKETNVAAIKRIEQTDAKLAGQLKQQLARASLLHGKPATVVLIDDGGDETVLFEAPNGLGALAHAARVAAANLLGALRRGRQASGGSASLLGRLTDEGEAFIRQLTGSQDPAIEKLAEGLYTVDYVPFKAPAAPSEARPTAAATGGRISARVALPAAAASTTTVQAAPAATVEPVEELDADEAAELAALLGDDEPAAPKRSGGKRGK